MFVVKSILDCARLCAIIVNCTTFNCRTQTCDLLDIFDDDRVLDKNLRCFTKSNEVMSASTQASMGFISFTSCRGSSSKLEGEQPVSTSYETSPSESSFIIRSTEKTSLVSSSRFSVTPTASASNSWDNAQTTGIPNTKNFTIAGRRVTSMPSTASMSTSITTLSISSPTPPASPTTDATATTASPTVDTTSTTTVFSHVVFATGFTSTATTAVVRDNNVDHTTSSEPSREPPTTATITSTTTQIPTTVSFTASSTQPPTTATASATSTKPAATATTTSTTTSTQPSTTATSTATSTQPLTTATTTSTQLPTIATSTATSTQPPTTATTTSTHPPRTVSSTPATRFHISITGFYPTLSATTIAPATPTTAAISAKYSPAPNVETEGTTVLTTTTTNPTSIITATTTTEDHIPAGHLRMCAFGGTFYNGSCYVFCNSQESFSSALTNCKDNSMTMIEAKNEEMDTFLVRFLSGKSKYYVWLSGVKIGRHWVWSDSTQQFTYTNWGSGQPDNMGRYHKDADCLALRTQTFQWEDLACSERSDYVCVFKWNGTTFPAISPDGKASLLNDCGNDGGKAFNGWCYRFVHPAEEWEKAKAYCEERHMRLLEIKSEKVQHFIAYFMQYVNPIDYFCVWTALQESNVGWVWQGSQEHVEYTNWAKNHPDDLKSLFWTEKCMTMNAEGHFWRRYSCTGGCQFICEYSNITTTTATPTTTTELPPGQLRQCQFGGSYFLGNCYVFFHDPGTAATAKTECHSRQMTLYEDTTMDKSEFIAQFLKTRSKGLVWMAGSDEEVEGRWVWSESRVPVTYTRWGVEQPDNGKQTTTAENCLAWDTVTSTWNDHDCQMTAGYLCEYRWNGSTFAETSPDRNVSLTGDCGQGGKKFMGRCYISAYPRAAWIEAKKVCEENNMKLVEIMSAGDQQFLEYYIKYIRPSGYECIWMGLSDAVLEGHWVWKASNEIPVYKNWAPGQPDCQDTFLMYGEDCAAMDHHDNKWHDKGCTSLLCDYVCEFNLPSTATTTLKPLPPGISRQCKFGGIFHKGHCHVHFHKMDTYVNAECTEARLQIACHTHDMRVCEDTSKDKTEFLALFLSTRTKNSVWLAGSDRDSEKNWRWLESKQPFTYTNWAGGQPDDDDGYFRSQDCLVYNAKWSDVSCGSTAEYVCESTWAGTTFDGSGEDLNLLDDCLHGGKVYRGSCYMYSHAGVSWHEAKKTCEARNMSLLEATSEEEHRFVSYYLSFINPENVICLWIGLSEIQEEGRWVWESSGKPVDYTNWNEGQPSGKPHFYSSDPDCVYIKLDSNNTWNDDVCSNECPFICEQRMDQHD